MKAILGKWGWFVVAALIVAYVTTLIAGSIEQARAAGVGAPVVIRDEWKDNAHHVSGSIDVGNDCDDISVRTQALTPQTTEIALTTVHQDAESCIDTSTPRVFRALVVGQPHMYFILTRDRRSIPTVLSQHIDL